MMNNFYLIDKPIWITSFDVLRKIKKILNVKKIWHTWTLDPLASWLLLVAVWNYTKLIPFLEKETKTYEFIISLDWTTPSFDKETKITFLSNEEINFYKKNLNIKKIEKILQEKFTWEIEQIPPKYSAIKINWKKALNMIRNWIDFELKKRKVIIYSIKIIDFSYPNLKLKAKVSAWTYIRSIANDLWSIIWTWWYITYLRRTNIWELWLSKSITLDNFCIEKTLKEKEIFKNIDFLELKDEIIKDLDNWKSINDPYNLKKDWIYFLLKNSKIAYVIEKKTSKIKNIKKI